MNILKQIGIALVVISTLAMIGCDSVSDEPIGSISDGSSSSIISNDSGDSSNSGGSSNSGNSGGSTTNTAETGIFVDAPVMGLHYKTDTQDGYTDAKGTFKYESGEKVEFFLGDLSLGKVEAGAMITPYTLAGVEDGNDASEHATNIALLLQNLDLHRDDALNSRQVKVLNKILDKGIENYEGGLNNRKYIAIAKTSSATATRDLKDLLDKGCIKQREGTTGKSTSYSVKIK